MTVYTARNKEEVIEFALRELGIFGVNYDPIFSTSKCPVYRLETNVGKAMASIENSRVEILCDKMGIHWIFEIENSDPSERDLQDGNPKTTEFIMHEILKFVSKNNGKVNPMLIKGSRNKHAFAVAKAYDEISGLLDDEIQKLVYSYIVGNNHESYFFDTDVDEYDFSHLCRILGI